MENNLSKIISRLRKEKGLTQKDLAEKLNVSDKAISRWENGKSYPDMDMLNSISKFFNVPLNDLIKARVSTNESDDEIVEEIINELSDIKKKNAKKIKIIITISLVFILILSVAFIFTRSYNRFKVYRVSVESDNIYYVNGTYVETRIKDSLYINNIKIRDYEENVDDMITVNLYYIENDKEHILQTFTGNLSGLDYYNHNLGVDDLSELFDKLYLKVTIIDKDNNVKEYTGKLIFVKEFSNNKIYSKDINDNSENSKSKYKSSKEITKILLENNYEERSINLLVKDTKDYNIKYNNKLNLIYLDYEKNKLSYHYMFSLSNNILKVRIFDENTTEVGNYKYDVSKNKIIECITGSCSDYEKAMEILDENVLYLLKE